MSILGRIHKFGQCPFRSDSIGAANDAMGEKRVREQTSFRGRDLIARPAIAGQMWRRLDAYGEQADVSQPTISAETVEDDP
ncbi:hypothetical protein [Bradyrhizobium guangdongense]|uniref:hypothetical protein n=1 Tax=Bradyrhizobium guangdongense TaxID=1325090 RepID=UPI001128834A|nr:hypothetical protein [Bradyrhizobium guangdongense]